jgi:hypothetical protein
MELTKEQIEKAAQVAYDADASVLRWNDYDIDNRGKEGWRRRMIAAAPHLQYAPAPVDGDVIEAAYRAGDLAIGPASIYPLTEGQLKFAQAFAQVLLDRVLGTVTLDEYTAAYDRLIRGNSGVPTPVDTCDEIVQHRRALIAPKPKTKQERVEELIADWGSAISNRDNIQSALEIAAKIAAIYEEKP